MDYPNLIDFKSPVGNFKDRFLLQLNFSASPGNNPFDSLLNEVESINNTVITITKAPDCSTDNLNNDFMNFEKESLLNLKDYDIGRESLGILKLETLNTSFGTDSLNSYRLRTNSYGNSNKFNDLSDDVFNIAFLKPCSYGESISSISSCNVSSLFNSGSLEASEPSKIYSVTSSKNLNALMESDIFNEAFLTEDINKKRLTSVSTLKPYKEIVENNLKEEMKNQTYRERTQSVPEFKKSESTTVITNVAQEVKFSDNNFIKKDETIIGDYDDYIFMEAIYIASQITNHFESLSKNYIDDDDDDDQLLDNIRPPFNVNLDESTSTCCSEDGLQKTLDNIVFEQKEEEKMLKPNVTPSKFGNVKQNLFNIFNNSSKLSCSHSSNSGSSKDANELLQNLSEIINNEQRDSKQNLEGQLLLFTLADILCSNSGKGTSNENFEGLNDSGHSSIEHEEQQNEDIHEVYEVLDLRVTSKSHDNEQVLDLSKKTNAQNLKRRLSKSFNVHRVLSPAKSINNKDSQTAVSLSNINSKNSFNDIKKLKLKKIEDKISIVKKGPLKAVIPVVDMSKDKSDMLSTTRTPSKFIGSSSTSMFKVKRTSTPISEPKLKPVAQSTPDNLEFTINKDKPNACSSQLKKCKFYCPVSPLPTQNSFDKISKHSNSNKSSHSGSAPNLSVSPKNSKKDSCIPFPTYMYRRHLASEIKFVKDSTHLRRSYSVGQDKKITSANSKIKSTSNTFYKKGNINVNKTHDQLIDSKGALLEKNKEVKPKIKSSNLFDKLRKNKTGKENTITPNKSLNCK